MSDERLTAFEAAAITEAADVEARIADILRRKRAAIDQNIRNAAAWGQGEIRLLWEHPSHQQGDFAAGGYGSDGSLYTPEMAQKILDSLREDGFTVERDGAHGSHLRVTWAKATFSSRAVSRASSFLKKVAEAAFEAVN